MMTLLPGFESLGQVNNVLSQIGDDIIDFYNDNCPIAPKWWTKDSQRLRRQIEHLFNTENTAESVGRLAFTE